MEAEHNDEEDSSPSRPSPSARQKSRSRSATAKNRLGLLTKWPTVPGALAALSSNTFIQYLIDHAIQGHIRPVLLPIKPRGLRGLAARELSAILYGNYYDGAEPSILENTFVEMPLEKQRQKDIHAEGLALHPDLYTDPGSPRPIYMVVYIPGVHHATLCLFKDNRMYNLGFAPLGKGPKNVPLLGNVVMFTPDIYFEPKGRRSNGDPYELRVVDAGVFTEAHEERLMRYTEKLNTRMEANAAIVASVGPKPNTYYGYLVYALDATYAYASCKRIVEKTKTLFNCTTSLEDIVGPTLRCPHSQVGAISEPENCKSNRPARANGSLHAYYESVVHRLLGMPMTEEQQAILAGGWRSRRRRSPARSRRSNARGRRSNARGRANGRRSRLRK